jgi:hypothetical protein
MTKLEKIELVLIPVACLGLLAATPWLPSELSIGHLLLALSGLLLLQSLIRDLFILMQTRAQRAAQTGTRAAIRCMCVESTVGITGIIAGACVLGLGIGPPVDMGAWGWTLVAFATLSGGFAIKDLVLRTDPWRVVRDPDHVNIVVSWKK